MKRSVVVRPATGLPQEVNTHQGQSLGRRSALDRVPTSDWTVARGPSPV